MGLLRYRVGLVMFVLPLLFAFFEPYAGPLIPDYEGNARNVSIALDAMLLLSLFVLGGEFWEKLRSLFIHAAHAVIPPKPASASHP